MEYLIFFNKFDFDKNKFIFKLKNCKILKKEEKYWIIDTNNLEYLRSLQEISKILTKTTNWKRLNFKAIKKDSLDTLKILDKKTYKIQTKFHDKIKISAKSIYKHVNPYLKYEEFILEDNPEVILFIEFKKSKNEIYYRISFLLTKEQNKAIDLKYPFTIIIENPRLVQEISDFLRLCWIFKMPLIIITKDNIDTLLNQAKKITKGIDYKTFSLTIANNLPKNITLIGFSKHAQKKEIELKEHLKTKKPLALVFGDDKFGLSQETRDRMDIMFRLTPELKKPLRASHALSYVLGIYTSLKI